MLEWKMAKATHERII